MQHQGGMGNLLFLDGREQQLRRAVRELNRLFDASSGRTQATQLLRRILHERAMDKRARDWTKNSLPGRF